MAPKSKNPKRKRSEISPPPPPPNPSLKNTTSATKPETAVSSSESTSTELSPSLIENVEIPSSQIPSSQIEPIPSSSKTKKANTPPYYPKTPSPRMCDDENFCLYIQQEYDALSNTEPRTTETESEEDDSEIETGVKTKNAESEVENVESDTEADVETKRDQKEPKVVKMALSHRTTLFGSKIKTSDSEKIEAQLQRKPDPQNRPEPKTSYKNVAASLSYVPNVPEYDFYGGSPKCDAGTTGKKRIFSVPKPMEKT